MTAHSPGPWNARAEWIDDVNGRPVANACSVGNHGALKVNARLIAAAPELLDALRAATGLDGGCSRCFALDDLHCRDPRRGMDCLRCEAARGLIARIEG